MSQVKEYTDAKGWRHVVRLVEAGDNPRDGVPLSVNFEALGQRFGIKKAAMLAVQQSCFEKGFIQPQDFLRPGVFDAVVKPLRKHYDKAIAKQTGHDLVVAVRQLWD